MIIELLKDPPAPATPLKGADRRRSRRHEMALVATLVPTDAVDAADRIDVEVRDISLHGAGLRTAAPLPVGQTYQMDVGGGPLKLQARAKVANARLKSDGHWDIGLEFY